MDPYIELSVMAKNAGGPEALIEKLAAGGFSKGVTVSAAVGALLIGGGLGINLLAKKYKTLKAQDLAVATADAIAKAEARRYFTVDTMRELQRGLTLAPGDRFRAHTRDGDVIMIQVEGRTDNPFFVSGAQLQQISDFTLDDIDDI